MTQNLRQVHALVLQEATVNASLRQVHLLTLSGPTADLGIPAGKKASETLISAILATASTAGKAVTAADFTLEDPVAITGTKNTSVKATASNLDAVSGTQTFRYDRKTIASAGYLFTAPIETGSGNTSVLAQLAKINALTGIVFEARDLVDTPIADGDNQVTLVAASTSYVFIPGTTLTIALHSSTPSLATAIANAQLNGFQAA